MRSVRPGFVLFLAVALGAVVVAGCGDEEETQTTTSVGKPAPLATPPTPDEAYTGSRSCRECHERFYELWAPSHHGLAMQPFTVELAKAELAEHGEDTVIGEYAYRRVQLP